ncbi:MAG: hypothetical protein MJZ26_12220 [Fibrobacter sp.]|nr:hypothetical protein [Fibrobacter sp.]
MALSRSYLKGMGLTEEQVSAIIDAHVETVNGLKEDITKYKADAEKLPGVQKELDDLKSEGGDWKTKFEKEHQDFEDYKAAETAKAQKAAAKEAYSKLCTEAGVSEKYLKTVLKATDFDSIKVDDKGELTGKEELTKAIKEDWADFISTDETQGAGTETPPDGSNGGGAKSPGIPTIF